MNRNNLSNQDSYEAWLGHNEEVNNLWQTTTGETFAVTENSIHLPDGIGPNEGEQQIATEKLEGYDVSVEYLNDTWSVSVPFLIGAVLSAGGLFFGAGFGMILFVAGVLALVGGAIMVVKERNDVTAKTHITFKMGPHETSLTVEGDLESEIHEVLSPHF